MKIFEADDPLVLSGEMDEEGYKPGERARIAKAKQFQEDLMSKKKPTAKKKPEKKAPEKKKADGRPRLVKKEAGAKKTADTPKMSHRVTTHKPNASTSVAIMPEPAVLDLGPIVLPDRDEAVAVIKGLAELNDRALQAKARYEAAKSKAKDLKDKWESLVEEVASKLRAATHGSDLPLFDKVEREQDVQAMTDAGNQAMTDVGKETPPKDVKADEDPLHEDPPF